MEIKLTFRYILAFLFLAMLCGLSHEMVHHVAGAVICGCWGYKTFNSFILCDTCADNPFGIIATIVGPLFTFGLMWLGWYQLRMPDNKNRQLGFALIFANFPINRILYAFMGYNDEQFATQKLFGESAIAFWSTIFIILLLTLPPLVASFKLIQNKFRVLWFLAYFILPFVFIIVFAGFFLEEYLLLHKRFLAEPLWGIPYLLLLTEIICLTGYYFLKRSLYSAGQSAENIS